MIVKKDWPNEDEVETFFIAAEPDPGVTGYGLDSYREVPAHLWAAYSAAVRLAALFAGRLEACPHLPAYVEFARREAREYQEHEKKRRALDERYEMDRLMQEQLRVAGLLKPLPLDSPDDEPVRIGDPRGQKIV